MIQNIGIIGFGQMGSFMASQLSNLRDVSVFDVIDKTQDAKKIGVKFATLEEVTSKDLVILAVPISRIEETCKTIAPHLKNNIVMDLCSVKIKPAKVMVENLPKSVDIIATHPLFGPQSGKDGLGGLNIMVDPIRSTKISDVEDIFKDLGLEILRVSCEEHDIQTAKTMGLDQFIAKILSKMQIEDNILKDPAFDKLLELKKMLEEDSEELFKLIQEENHFVKEVRTQFIDVAKQVDGGLKWKLVIVPIGIATLGPEGSDSQMAALEIRNMMFVYRSQEPIHLLPSFKEARDFAIENDTYFLIPAAFSARDLDGKVLDTWGDWHFREEDMNIRYSFLVPLQEMAIAKRKDVGDLKSIVLHPATEVFAQKYFPEVEKIYSKSKPIAVKDCSEGIADLCIGSVPVIERFDNLEIVKKVIEKDQKMMLWAVYQPKKYEW